MRGSCTLRAVGTDTASKSTENPRRGLRGGVLTACSCEHGVAGTAIQRWTPRSDTHQSRHASASAQAHARCHDAVGLGLCTRCLGPLRGACTVVQVQTPRPRPRPSTLLAHRGAYRARWPWAPCTPACPNKRLSDKRPWFVRSRLERA